MLKRVGKMTIKIPYTKTELVLAAITASSKIEEKQEELVKRLNEISIVNNGNVNEAVAKHNGITVLDLINSPNMQLLIEQWYSHNMEQAVKILKDYGLTEVEAWSCLLADKLESL
jgi:hypothetical protein